MTPPANGSTLDPPDGGTAASSLDRTLELVDELAAVLEAHLEALTELAPRLRPLRRFDDGAWVIGAQGERARDEHAFGRLVFHLRPDAAAGRLRVEARASVGARDRRVQQLDVELDSDASEHLRAFAERISLDFARAYFASGPATTRSAFR